jgi:hypothetical protein
LSELVVILAAAVIAVASQASRSACTKGGEAGLRVILVAGGALGRQELGDVGGGDFDLPQQRRHVVEQRVGVDGEVVLLGGLEIEPSHTQKMKSSYAKDAGNQTPRSSRFHFHPPGTAFYQAPFAATKAISKNPT